MKRDTVGKIALDLMQKAPESRNPIDLEREMQQDYLKNLIECTQEATKKYPGDFFLVVITKRERLMDVVFRNYFFARSTCPTPDYDQSVFKYNHNADGLEYIWSIPSQDACHYLKDNALEVHSSERDILNYVLQFADGSLFKLAQKLNGEIPQSPLLII